MSENEIQEKKVKRKKSKPRFTSVKKEEFDQFLHDVNEYKQILKSIGMYDLCQNWKQKRNIERNEQKKERLKLKIKKQKEKEKIGNTLYQLKKSQQELFEVLDEDKEELEEEKEIQDEELPTLYQEYNKAYQNQQSLSEIEEEQQGSLQQNEEDSRRNNQDDILQDNTQSFQKGFDDEDDQDKFNNSRNQIRQDKDKSLTQDSNDRRRFQSKKKANLVSKSLKKHQFRSQENSEIENVDQYFAEQELTLQDLNNKFQQISNHANTNRKQNQNSEQEDLQQNQFSRGEIQGNDYSKSDEESVVRETDNEQFLDESIYTQNPQMHVELNYQSSSKNSANKNDYYQSNSDDYIFPPGKQKTKQISNSQNSKKIQNTYSEEDISSESTYRRPNLVKKQSSQKQQQKQPKYVETPSNYSDDIENLEEEEDNYQNGNKQNIFQSLKQKSTSNKNQKTEQYIDSNEDESNLIQIPNSDLQSNDQQTSSSYFQIVDAKQKQSNKKKHQQDSQKPDKQKKIKKNK